MTLLKKASRQFHCRHLTINNISIPAIKTNPNDNTMPQIAVRRCGEFLTRAKLPLASDMSSSVTQHQNMGMATNAASMPFGQARGSPSGPGAR